MPVNLKVFVLFAHFCVLCLGIEATPTYDTSQIKHSLPTCGGVGYDFAYESGRCYKFHPERRFWVEAREVCRNEGGDLAVMNSEAEARVVVEMFKKYPAESIIAPLLPMTRTAFLGFYYSTNGLRTIDGETLEQAGYYKPSWPYQTNFHIYSYGLIDRDGMLRVAMNLPFMFICEKGPQVF